MAARDCDGPSLKLLLRKQDIDAHTDNNEDKYNDVFSIYQDAIQVPSFTTRAKLTPVQPAKAAFRAMSASTSHREDIAWLADNKIAEGWKVGDTYEFRGMSSVVRQDMAAFIHRLDEKILAK